MFYPNGNEQPTSPEADYWRSRAEELARYLTETRALLMQVASLLPAEHLSKLQLNMVPLDTITLDDQHVAAWPDSSALAE